MPRAWTPDEIEVLGELALSAQREIVLRASEREARETSARVMVAMDAARLGAWSYDIEAEVRWNGAEANRILGNDPVEGPVPVAAWLEKARQVVLNLLSNAVKFTAPGGRVRVTCADRAPRGGLPAMVEIRVEDTGRGIPSAQLEQVFDPFVQVGRLLTSEQSGTGLGLAISRDLARGMGGEITVTSTEGVGSTFVVTLPRA